MNETIMIKLKGQLAALSYIAVMLVLGLPLWWKTTEVYRAVLPYDAIDALSDIHTVTQRVNVLLITPDANTDHVRGPELQKLLVNSKIFELSLNVRSPRQEEVTKMESSKSLEELDASLGKDLSVSQVGWVVLLETPAVLLEPFSPVTLGNHRVVYYSSKAKSEDIAATIMDNILGEFSMVDMWGSSRSFIRSRSSDNMRKKTTGEIDLQLSLLVPEPEYVIADWEIEQAVSKYVQPFIDQFPLKVTINSQILYLTELNIPESKEGQGPLEVSSKDLGTALNRMESLLSSQSSTNPSINLMVYIPPIHRTPLTIQGSTTNSYLVPRWGGVHIYNYITPNNTNFKFPAKIDLDMEHISGIWLGQLRSLMGVKSVDATKALELPAVGVRGWEVDYQLRYRSQENIMETRGTLQSLSSLLSQISNIVITEEIARRFEVSLNAIEESLNGLKSGNLMEGYVASQLALLQSEAAFFDPSLLALLYFPDDQKYAIYVPYFLPVGLPILMSIKSIIKLIKNKEKTD